MWAEEMSQQLKALVTPPENKGSIPSTHRTAHNCLQLQFQCALIVSLLTSVGTRLTHGAHTHTQANTHTHKINY